jgi:thymidine phosphorylase
LPLQQFNFLTNQRHREQRAAGGPATHSPTDARPRRESAIAHRRELAQWLEDGTAWRKFVAMVEAQNGGASALEKITAIHHAAIVHPLRATAGGAIRRMDAEALGRGALFLGAGRAQATDAVDLAVRHSQIKKPEERAQPNEPLMRVDARKAPHLAAALPLLERAALIE